MLISPKATLSSVGCWHSCNTWLRAAGGHRSSDQLSVSGFPKCFLSNIFYLNTQHESSALFFKPVWCLWSQFLKTLILNTLYVLILATSLDSIDISGLLTPPTFQLWGQELLRNCWCSLRTCCLLKKKRKKKAFSWKSHGDVRFKLAETWS